MINNGQGICITRRYGIIIITIIIINIPKRERAFFLLARAETSRAGNRASSHGGWVLCDGHRHWSRAGCARPPQRGSSNTFFPFLFLLLVFLRFLPAAPSLLSVWAWAADRPTLQLRLTCLGDVGSASKALPSFSYVLYHREQRDAVCFRLFHGELNKTS
ncbi:hypothetical protein B0T26DRAFT_721583 [Lasiosphaeria miniovina]|uniref:Uncharacterized protein n=1 Tax=Lasiosphaeria miniovina TaxID=1954250 RepID=A0AA40A534_9PEZI|nr:uncharacterized protein B0T26DRAFT_721583 [Lasiosphaeria miniovina]KAK0709454.1 hypothetical protein B0T26DRAFT_721583 [Lasiosphaeria miniovina]